MKLLQWNIWYKEDIKNILSTIKEIKPDVICLQELTINHPHHNQNIDTPRFIAEGLGFEYFFKEAQKVFQMGMRENMEMQYLVGILLSILIFTIFKSCKTPIYKIQIIRKRDVYILKLL